MKTLIKLAMNTVALSIGLVATTVAVIEKSAKENKTLNTISELKTIDCIKGTTTLQKRALLSLRETIGEWDLSSSLTEDEVKRIETFSSNQFPDNEEASNMLSRKVKNRVIRAKLVASRLTSEEVKDKRELLVKEINKIVESFIVEDKN